MTELIEALQGTGNIGIIAAVAFSTATIVWKIAQYANRIMITIQQQKYSIDNHAEQLKENKQHLTEITRIQGIHHTRLTKLEAK